MLEKISLKTIYNYNLIQNNDKIVVGVSGGADSIALLHFLNCLKSQLNLELFAVHINHCMRGQEAEDDTLFVKKTCENLNISLDIFYYDIKSKSKELNMTLEEAGRHFRYKAFSEILEKYNAQKIAVAHNKNDNIETFFIRLLRGSGIKGLSCIPFKRDNIIRPFLACDRELIEKYCEQNKISFRNDSTNFQSIYTRNKIRLNLIPFLKKNFNPNLLDTISNTIYSFNEENVYLENLTKESFKKCLSEKTKNSISLNIISLKQNDIVIQKRILRLALNYLKKDLYNVSFEHIHNILDLLSKQSGKMLNLPNDINCKIIYDNLVLYTKNSIQKEFMYELLKDTPIFIEEISKFVLLTKNIENNVFFSTKVCTISLDCDKIKDSLIFRTRKAGDTILLNGMHKKLKNIFIDLKIPSFKRDITPILTCGNDIVSIPELFVSDNYKISKNTKNIIYLHLWEE